MVRQLLLSHDNGQSMVIFLRYEHSPSVVIASDNGQSMVIYP